jgi:hypothetical protein
MVPLHRISGDFRERNGIREPCHSYTFSDAPIGVPKILKHERAFWDVFL